MRSAGKRLSPGIFLLSLTLMLLPVAGTSRALSLEPIDDGLIPVGDPAPDFEHELSGGGRFRLSDHRGEVVWLVFWRADCPPCRAEMPFLERMHREHSADGLTIVGLNCFDSREAGEVVLGEYETSFLNVLDPSDEAGRTYGELYRGAVDVSALPLNYVIGKGGEVARAWYGFDDERGAKERLLEVLRAGEDLQAVVDFLLGYVRESGCVFIRNGREYDCGRAARHIERKYRHFSDEIETPEDFIRLSATRSEMSGRPYMVKTAGGRELPCAEWLKEALGRYRKQGD